MIKYSITKNDIKTQATTLAVFKWKPLLIIGAVALPLSIYFLIFTEMCKRVIPSKTIDRLYTTYNKIVNLFSLKTLDSSEFLHAYPLLKNQPHHNPFLLSA